MGAARGPAPGTFVAGTTNSFTFSVRSPTRRACSLCLPSRGGGGSVRVGGGGSTAAALAKAARKPSLGCCCRRRSSGVWGAAWGKKEGQPSLAGTRRRAQTNKKKIAQRGFDPRSSRLWAWHANHCATELRDHDHAIFWYKNGRFALAIFLPLLAIDLAVGSGRGRAGRPSCLAWAPSNTSAATRLPSPPPSTLADPPTLPNPCRALRTHSSLLSRYPPPACSGGTAGAGD